MQNGKLLWVDDEIDLLRAHIIFLENKGYDVDTATNGVDALEMCENGGYDLIMLDENMPGPHYILYCRNVLNVLFKLYYVFIFHIIQNT